MDARHLLQTRDHLVARSAARVAAATAILLVSLAGAGHARAAAATKPTVTITSAPASPTTATDARFGFSVTGAKTVRCDLDGNGFTRCSSPVSYSGLVSGTHKFTVSASTSRDSATANATWTITAPPPTGSTNTGTSGSTLPDSGGAQPTSEYARGIFTTSAADFTAIAGLGFRFGMASAYHENFDRANASGLKLIAWLGGYSQTTCSFAWTDDEIRARVADVKGHPALFAYFIDDEPHAGPECPNTPAQIRERNALVKSLDPSKPTVITENRPDAYDDLAGAADVMGLVIYPCNVNLGGCDWNKIPERTRLAEQAGVQHYWGVTQTAGDEYYKQPTPEELQHILDQWHATRAEGQFAYTWDCCGTPLQGLRDAPALWPVWQAENAR
jgi:hypothetical protein